MKVGVFLDQNELSLLIKLIDQARALDVRLGHGNRSDVIELRKEVVRVFKGTFDRAEIN